MESYYAKRVDWYAFKVGQMMGTADTARYNLQAVLETWERTQAKIDPEHVRFIQEAIRNLERVVEIGNERKESA